MNAMWAIEAEERPEKSFSFKRKFRSSDYEDATGRAGISMGSLMAL